MDRRAPGRNLAVMADPLEYPTIVLVGSFLAQFGAAHLGDWLGRRRAGARGLDRRDFATVLTASLTLLALIIGFALSMAVSRYDQRKNYEEAEANAIGTEYLRVSLLPSPDGPRALLARYTGLRICFYQVRNERALETITAQTGALQDRMWASVAGGGRTSPTPVTALVLSGMNDVINAQGYTQAAWWNQIPMGAWLLMLLVAVSSNLLLGYGEEHRTKSALAILPLIVSAAFVLIADVDSPRHGIIRNAPENLIALDHSFRPPEAPP